MGAAKIFINYRNGEHTPLVNDLYERLAHHFGEDQVFLDRYTIRPGGRYPNELRDGVAHADVLISIIHREWRTQRDGTGLCLLDRERDWVREELEIALPDNTKTVIALLVDDTERLTADDLPASIAELALRQSLRIRATSLADDVRTLIDELELHVAPAWSPGGQPPRRTGPPWPRSYTAVLGLVVLPLWVVSLMSGGQSGTGAPPLLYAVIFSAFVMALRLVAGVVAWLVLQPGANAVEHVVQRMAPTPYYRRIGIPAAVVIILFAGASGTSAAVADHVPNFVVYLLIAVTVLLVLANVTTAAVHALKEERAEEQRVRAWPQPLPLPPDPVALRRELTTLEDRMYGWRTPLTRAQRDKATWALSALRDYQAELTHQANLGLAAWLRTDQRSRLLRYLIWTAGTLGGLIAVVLPRTIHHLLSPVHAVIDVLAGTAILCALSLTILDVERRSSRNRVRAVDADATESLDRLARQFKELD